MAEYNHSGGKAITHSGGMDYSFFITRFLMCLNDFGNTFSPSVNKYRLSGLFPSEAKKGILARCAFQLIFHIHIIGLSNLFLHLQCVPG